jgi:tetratricopeptide (TPR) repeat protein
MRALVFLLFASLLAAQPNPVIIEGNRLLSQRKYVEAEQLFTRSIDGADRRTAAILNNNLGTLYYQQARYAEAEAVYKRALELYGDDFALLRAMALSNIGELLRIKGKYAEAEAYHRKALSLREVSDEDESGIAASLNSIACLLTEMGRLEEAERAGSRALTLSEKAGEDVQFAAIVHNLGEIYRLQKRYAEAEAFYRRALAIRQKLHGPAHPDTSGALGSVSALLYELGRLEEAMELGRRTLDIRIAKLGPSHPLTAATHSNVSLIAAALGDTAAARKHSERAIEIWNSTLGAQHPNIAIALVNLGEFQFKDGEFASADDSMRRAVEILDNSSENHTRLPEVLLRWAALYVSLEKTQGAEKLIRRAMSIQERNAKSNTPEYAEAQKRLAHVFRLQKRFTEAARIERAFR